MLAAWTWDWHTSIAALVAFLLGWLLTVLFWNRGKKHEEVLRRVVETSTDESTRIKTLADEHNSALKLKDEALVRLKGDHDGELVALRADRDKALAEVKAREVEVNTHKAEATKLQGLVGTVDTSKKEIDDLRAQLAKQKGDYELTLGDWRKRAEAGEAAKVAAEKRVADLDAANAKVVSDWQAKFNAAETAKVAAEKRIVDLDATHARAIGEWQTKVSVAETKQTEIQGLMGTAKADNDKMLLEWRSRAEKAEGELGNWSRRYAELETSSKAATGDHDRVLSEWRARAEKAETTAKQAGSVSAEWDGKYKALEADRNKINADWQSRFAAVEAAKVAAEQKHVEVQGLLGNTKADNDRVLGEWRSRTEKAEADAAAALKLNADWDGRYKALEADRNKINADWDGRYKALEADRNKINADWDGKYKALEADRNKINADWDAKFKALEADRNKINAEWDGKYKALEADRAKALADWEGRYKTLQTDHSGCAARLQSAEAKHGEVQGLLGTHQTEITELKAQLAKATAKPDDLKVIEGIGPKIDLALRADGITTWAQVRDASQDRLRSAIEKGGISFAPSMTTWSKQAGYLVAGDMVGFKQYTEYLVSGQDPSALGAQELTGTDRAQALASGAVYGTGTVEVEESAKNKDGGDNLLIIEGIGPKFNEALMKAGLNTFAKVAAASEDQLRSAIQVAGLSFAPSLTTWAEQAGLLAAGDMDNFRALTARLVAGRQD